MKGVPHSCAATIDDFAKCLDDGTPLMVDVHTLQMKRSRMSRVKITKKGLNRVFVKFPVSDDSITCTPLMKDNQYL